MLVSKAGEDVVEPVKTLEPSVENTNGFSSGFVLMKGFARELI